MIRITEFSSLLRNLQCSNRYKQSAVVKDIAEALQEANANDLQDLLELLISTHDLDIQIKLFYVLAAYLINNGINNEIIVKYNPVYDTIQNLLVRGLPMKAAVALNFVTALLSCHDGDTRSLAIYAQNMIRVSGCLNTMSDMFSGSMMYQDTWIALCQSLAEACRGSEVNQNYCSHLIPLCVQRCRQGNVDVCTVLQSLLHNHERNLQLFIESEGLSIFTRPMLQYNMGMQLLNTTVEKSPVAVSTLRASIVVDHLRNFLRLYGPYSQMGQWATIILYHLDKGENSMMERSQRSVSENRTGNVSGLLKRHNWNNKVIIDKSKQRDDARNISSNREKQRSQVGDLNGNTTSRTELVNNIDKNHTKQDDTGKLFQNVIKEVLYWKSKENSHPDRPFNLNIPRKFVSDIPNRAITPVKIPQNCYRNVTKQNIRHNTHEKDLTFSFLMKESMQDSSKQYINRNNNKLIESIPTSSHTNNATSYDKEVQTHESILYNSAFYNETKIDLKNFRPPFISTPKHNKTNKTNFSKITHRSRASTTCINRKQTNRLRPKLAEKSKQEQTHSETRDTKHKSMSERLFSAINESCTTIVKGMKSIFRTKNENDRKKDDENTNEIEESCSYSFTNYMRKRDALIEGEFTYNDDSSSGTYKVNSCKTCKDTIVLQQKMKRDDHLKQTVRKLKMGINLYGCDFKKISHAMWPRDRYMTPDMLYNLYRKLIVKGGHDNHSFRLKAHNAIRKQNK